jgi:peptide/nickel transport system substrate-binding protein
MSRRRVTLQAMRLGLGALAAPALAEALMACAPAGGNIKKITWSRGDDLRSQDPQAISGLMEGTISRVLYDPLVDTDTQGKLVGALATEWTMAPEGTSFTFKLRTGVKFHDGSDFNADAVVFTYERLLKNPTFQLASAFKDLLTKVTAVDATTVKFDLAQPNPGLINSFTIPIMSPAAEKKHGAEFFKQIGGTGPFKFKSWAANQQWVGEANKAYWVKDLVKVDEYVFRSIPEDATRVAAFQSGEIDVIDGLSGDQAEQLGKDANVTIVRSPGTSMLAITFNVRKDPFKLKEARLAVSYAIDRENIVKNITKLGKNVGAPIPLGTPGHDEKLFASPLPFDMGKAREMFQTAKLQPGTKVSFKMNPAGFPKLKETGEYIANQLRTVGFDVELQFLEPGAYTDARKSGQFDIAIQEVGRAQNPGPNYKILIGDSAFGNFYKEINPGIVGMIQQAQAELDATKRDAAYKKVQQAIYDDNVEFPVYFRELIWGVRKRVQGFQGRVTGDTRVFYCDVK